MAETFGAKVQLAVDTSASAQSKFRKQIQNSVNKSTESNPIKISNLHIALDKTQQKTLQESLQNYLNGDTSTFTLKISKIDASAAVNTLRTQLETMLAGLGITGVREFVGESTSASKGASSGKQPATDNTKQKTTDLAAYRVELENVNRVLKETRTSQTALENGKGFSAVSSEYTEISQKLLDWQTRVTELKSGQTSMTDEAIRALANEGVAINEVIRKLQQMNAESTKPVKPDASQAEASMQRILTLYNQLQTLISNTPRLASSPELSAQAQMLSRELENAKNGVGTLNNADVSRITTGISGLRVGIREAGIQGNSLLGFIKQAISKFSSWYFVTRAVTAAVRTIKDMTAAVIELDTAMTELRKVTDETSAVYDKFFDNAAERARKLGAVMSDVISATSDFARMGYSIEESSELADVAIIYQHVADGIDGIDTATAHLISTMKGFGISANDAMSVADKFNEVANRFPVTAANLGEIMQRSSAALSSANNTLDESLGLAVGAQQVLQNDSVVGTTLKTISMYLRASKAEAEEAGIEIDGMAESTSKLRAQILQLTKGSVDIMEPDGQTFKSTYNILKDISEVYNDMADVDVAAITELIAGKRNANAAIAILKNFKDVEAAAQTAMNAEGSALAENEKYLDSIAGHIAIYKAEFEALASKMVESDIAKLIVDMGSGILKGFALMADGVGGITTAITLAGTALTLFKAKIVDIDTTTGKFSTIFSGLFGGGAKAKQDYNIDLLRSYEEALLSGADASEQLYAITERGSGATQAQAQNFRILASQGQLAAGATDNYAASVQGATLKTFALTAANIALNAALSFGIGLAINLVITGITKLINRKKDAVQAAKDLQTEYEQLASSLDSLKSELESVNEQIDKLSASKTPSLVDQKELALLKEQREELELEVALTERLAQLKKVQAADAAYKSYKEQFDYSVTDTGTVDSATGEIVYRGQVSPVEQTKEAISEIERLSALNKELKQNSLNLDVNSKAWKKNEKQIAANDKLIGEFEAELVKLFEGDTETTGLKAIYDQLDRTNPEHAVVMDDIASAIKTFTEFVGGSSTDVKTTNADGVLQYVSEQIAAIEQRIALLRAVKQGSLLPGDVAGLISFDGEQAELHQANMELARYKSLLADISVGVSDFDISTAVTEIENLTSVFEKAQAEMLNGGSLSTDAQASIIEAMGDVEGLIYTENGIVKLNTQLWRDNAKVKTASIMQDANDNVSSLEARNTAIIEQIASIENMLDVFDSGKISYVSVNDIEEARNSLSGLRAEFDDNVAAIKQYNTAIERANALTVSFREDSLITFLGQVEDSYQSVVAAIYEVNTTGVVTADTLRLLINNNLISYLEKTSSGFKLNSDTIKDYEARLVNATLLEIEIAKKADLAALATGNLAGMTAGARQALEDFNSTGKQTPSILDNISSAAIGGAANLAALAPLLSITTGQKDAVSSYYEDIAAAITKSLGAIKSNVSSKNAVEEYTADVKNLTAAEKLLLEVEKKLEYAALKLDAAYSESERVRILKEELELYERQQEALHAVNEEHRAEIALNVEKLRSLGFDVDYRAYTNELYISNLEHINSLTGTTTEETNKYRKSIEELIDSTEELNAANAENSSKWYDVKEAMESAREEIVNKTMKAYEDFIKYADDFNLWDNIAGSTNRLKVHQEQLEALHREYQNGMLKDAEDYKNLLNEIALVIYQEQKTAIEDIIELTKRLIKQEAEDQIKALEDQLKLLNDIIDAKKKSLEETRNQEKYEKELAKRLTEIAKLQSRIDVLALDDSRDAAAQRLALEEELAEKQLSLDEFMADNAYESAQDALDRIQEAQENQSDAEIAEIKARTEKEADLYRAAVNRINSDWQNLYNDLYRYLYEYGDGTQAELDNLAYQWELASQAVQKYGDVVSALQGIEVENAVSNINGNGATDPKDTALLTHLIRQMKSNSIAWHTANEAQRKELEAANVALASQVSSIIGQSVVKDANGTWYLGSAGSGKKLYDYYHQGGIAGEKHPSLKDNEVMSVLERGEAILNEPKKESLYKLIDFADELSARLNKAVNGFDFASLVAKGQSGLIPDYLSGADSVNNSFAPTLNLVLNYSGDASEADAHRFGEVVSNSMLDKLHSAFSQRGTPLGSAYTARA